LKESINDGPHVQQLVERRERSDRGVLTHGGAVVGPLAQNKGSRAVGQQHHPVLAVVSTYSSQDR
jgi:hypothetical protein